jgi:predicted GNAT family N-acyltransferase
LELKKISTIADFCDAVSIRLKVFEMEQGVPCELEIDDGDKAAEHFLALVDKAPVGCSRMIIMDKTAKLGRIAVLREHRGRGVGKALCNLMIEQASLNGCIKVMIEAQTQAAGFYEKLGFSPYGEVFPDAGIEHIRMDKIIEDKQNPS